jgi:predicted nucleotide-binding protein
MQALRIPRAIGEHYAYKPTTPLNIAAALDMQPTSGPFRQLAGASIAYGLTGGGPNASEVSIEPLGLKIVRPISEGEDNDARREALLKPRVFGEFLRKYDKASLPREDIGRNVLVEMGVPQERAAEVLEMIVEGAETVGFLKTIKDKRYVDLSSAPPSGSPGGDTEADSAAVNQNMDSSDSRPKGTTEHPEIPAGSSTASDRISRRVFIAHVKNRQFLEPIKKLLGFGGFEPLVSVERPSVSQPVPDKVFTEMRLCGAAIIHVDAELLLTDADGKEHPVLNPNVLIEIGAAIALYGRRYILLVRDGVKLPSDLQGLFEVRYKGDLLDSDATIRLLEAINDFKNHAIPDRYPKE